MNEIIKDRSKPREPVWGMQAAIQFMFICVLAALLYNALAPKSAGPHTTSTLLSLDHALRDIVHRLDRFFEGIARFQLNGLSPTVGIWSLTALIANLLSALLLFVTCVFGWNHERARVRVVVGAFSVLAMALTVVTAPFLYATVTTGDGKAIPIDAAVASLSVYVCCLVMDWVSAIDYPAKSAERASYLSSIVAVDFPCIAVTALFAVCDFYIHFPPEFVVGTVAALFAYYSIAFLLLSALNWTNTTRGRSMIARIKGNVLLVIVLGAALNGVVGTIVQIAKLPIYLDMVGSFVVGAMCGMLPAMLSAGLGVLILGVTTTPVAIAYIGTAVLVAGAAVFLLRYGFMSSIWRTGFFGLFVLGPFSTLLSVPVTVYLFSGVTFAGSDAMTLLFVKMGNDLFDAVVKGAIVFDALDKGIAAILAYAIFKRIPEHIRTALRE